MIRKAVRSWSNLKGAVGRPAGRPPASSTVGSNWSDSKVALYQAESSPTILCYHQWEQSHSDRRDWPTIRQLKPVAIDPNSVQIVSNSNGTVGVGIGGKISYTAPANFRGTATITYKVFGVDHTASNVATVSVVVNRPTANDDIADTDGTTR